MNGLPEGCINDKEAVGAGGLRGVYPAELLGKRCLKEVCVSWVMIGLGVDRGICS